MDEEELREAMRKLNWSLEADLPADDDIYNMNPDEFNEKYAEEMTWATLKRK